jgi:FkbM family methyltransferase
MMHVHTLRAMRAFPFRTQLRLLRILLSKKCRLRVSAADEACFARYSAYVKIQQQGALVEGRNGHLVQLSYPIDNRLLYAWIRRDASDLEVFDSVIMRGEYQVVIEELSKQYTSGSPLQVVDAGGNIGLFSVFLHHHFPEAQITLIEPDTSNLAVLQRNMQVNKMEGQVKVLKRAVWTNNNMLELDNSFRDGKEWSLHVRASESVSEQMPNGVKGITLAELVADAPNQALQLFKLDIEGAERFLFHDAAFNEALLHSVLHVVIEIHDEYAIRPTIYSTFEAGGFDRIESGDVTWFARKNDTSS